VVNLRYPGAGETSGIAIRAMGMGKPVILSDGLETAPFPTAACLRIDTQCAEREMLENYLGFLHSYPEARRQIGVQAQQYIRRQHNCHRVGKQLWDILVSARPGNG
jgi:hypothetical protein